MLTILTPGSTPLATVIFLHGLSQTSESWLPWVERLAEKIPNIKWILPQADIGPIAYDNGEEAPRWFDVRTLPANLDEDDLLAAQCSQQRIQEIIKNAIRDGSSPNKIFLIGFSQGSAMALFSGLTFEHTLGGIGVLAGWLPAKLRESMELEHVARSPPIFWAHGTADRPIPLDTALKTMHWLRLTLDIGDSLTFKDYPGLTHAVNDDVLCDLSFWIAKFL